MDAVLKPVEKRFERKSPEQLLRPSREEAEAAVRTILAWTGDDPDREGLLDTPKRVVKAISQLYGGYFEDPAEHLERTFEDVGGYQDIVLVRGIPFHSHCEHHMLPFIGEAHIAYYPAEGVVGLSKLARVVDIYAKRLQTQENLTAQIASVIDRTLAPRGLAVMLEAEHQCMTMRGVQKPGVSTITTQFTGVFQDDPAEQAHVSAPPARSPSLPSFKGGVWKRPSSSVRFVALLSPGTLRGPYRTVSSTPGSGRPASSTTVPATASRVASGGRTKSTSARTPGRTSTT